jgi:hypothetical protein
MNFLIGQRVILNSNEVGTVVKPEKPDLPNTAWDVWVFSPSNGYASRYAVHNVKPLPNGQL